MLAGAAADAWGVPRDSCRTERSAVIHAASTRRLSYGELAARAATRPVPEKAPWKAVSAFTLMGTPPLLADMPVSARTAALPSLTSFSNTRVGRR